MVYKSAHLKDLRMSGITKHVTGFSIVSNKCVNICNDITRLLTDNILHRTHYRITPPPKKKHTHTQILTSK